uniref:CAP-Gly domain-containing protein n=1 Tax=Steinernema glaseri TaxID=37863 RepID=A0A1I7Y5L6_9BILA
MARLSADALLYFRKVQCYSKVPSVDRFRKTSPTGDATVGRRATIQRRVASFKFGVVERADHHLYIVPPDANMRFQLSSGTVPTEEDSQRTLRTDNPSTNSTVGTSVKLLPGEFVVGDYIIFDGRSDKTKFTQ